MMNAMIAKLTAWDVACFSSFFRQQGSPHVERCMRIVSASADGWLYPLMCLIFLVFAADAAVPFIFAAAAAFALEQPAYHILKRTTKRARPCNTVIGVRSRIIPLDRFSFPSGHTAAAWVMAVLLGTCFPSAAVPAYLWAACVGLSRIYLGVHYPSDVLAGMLLGAACALAGVSVIS